MCATRFLTTVPTRNLEINYVGSTAPANPWIGMLWADTSDVNALKLKVYTSEGWRQIDALTLSGVSVDQLMRNPINVPLSLVGDNTFLSNPIYGEYEGCSSVFQVYWRGWPAQAFVVGEGGVVYTYHTRTNFRKQRIYISTVELGAQNVSRVNWTSTEYRPPFLSSTDYLDYVVCATKYGMLVRGQIGGATKYYWIDYNGAANPIYHTACDVTSIYNYTSSARKLLKLGPYPYFALVYSSSNVVKIRIYDLQGNLVTTASGLDLSWPNSPHVLYPSTTTSIYIGHIFPYVKVNNDGTIVLRVFMTTYVVNTTIHPEYSVFMFETEPYEPGSSSLNCILPEERIDVEHVYTEQRTYGRLLDHPFLNCTAGITYLYGGAAFDVSTVGRQCVLLVKQTSSGFQTRLLNMSWNDAFDACFDWFKGSYVSFVIPDMSLIGKQVSSAKVVRLSNEDVVVCFADSQKYGSGWVVIRGFDINNFDVNSWEPTEVVRCNTVNMTGLFSSNTSNNVVYRHYTSSGKMYLEEYSSLTSLMSKTPDSTVVYDNYTTYMNNIMQEYINYLINNYGSDWASSNRSTSYYGYPIPTTNWLLAWFAVSVKPSTTVLYKNALCVINGVTGQRLTDFIIYAEGSTNSLGCWYVNRLAFYKDESNGDFYVLCDMGGHCIVGNVFTRVLRLKIASDASIIVYNVSTLDPQYSDVFIHPDPNWQFCVVGYYVYNALACGVYRAGSPSRSYIETLQTMTIPSFNTTNYPAFVCIRGSVGRNVNTLDMPVLQAGRSYILPGRTVELPADKTLYLWLDADGEIKVSESEPLISQYQIPLAKVQTAQYNIVPGSTELYKLTIFGNMCLLPDGRIGINVPQLSGIHSGLTLNTSLAVATKKVTTNYTVTAVDSVIIVDTSTSVTLTLPKASSCPGRVYVVKTINTGTVIIDPHGTELIDGVQTFSMTGAYKFVTIASDGIGWQIIARSDLYSIDGYPASHVPAQYTIPVSDASGALVRWKLKNVSEVFQTLQISNGQISWDVDLGATAKVTLTSDAILLAPTNLVAGGFYVLVVKQDSTGYRQLSFDSIYKFSYGPYLSMLPNSVTIFTFFYDGEYLYGDFSGGFV